MNSDFLPLDSLPYQGSSARSVWSRKPRFRPYNNCLENLLSAHSKSVASSTQTFITIKKSCMTHWCTILLLSAHPKCVAGSTQTFITINKSPVWVVKQITSLTELIDPCTIVTLPPSPPHTLHQSFNHFLHGRWSTSSSEGGDAHFFNATRIRSGGQEKIKQTNKYEQYAWG